MKNKDLDDANKGEEPDSASQKDNTEGKVSKEEQKKRLLVKLDQELLEFEERGGFA